MQTTILIWIPPTPLFPRRCFDTMDSTVKFTGEQHRWFSVVSVLLDSFLPRSLSLFFELWDMQRGCCVVCGRPRMDVCDPFGCCFFACCHSALFALSFGINHPWSIGPAVVVIFYDTFQHSEWPRWWGVRACCAFLQFASHAKNTNKKWWKYLEVLWQINFMQRPVKQGGCVSHFVHFLFTGGHGRGGSWG